MIANPKPQNSALSVNPERAMMKTDPAGPEAADSLQREGTMTGIGLEQPVLLISQPLQGWLQ